MNERSKVWVAFGAVLSLAALLAAYYYFHKPITPAQAVSLAGVAADAGVAALLTVLGGSLGRRCLSSGAFDFGPAGAGRRVVVEVALGWGLIGLALLVLGLARLYYSLALWALVLAALAALWRDARGWLADLGQVLRGLVLPEGGGRASVTVPAVYVGFILAAGGLRALAPPLMWDALVYHLTLPKLYVQNHGLQLQADFLFTGMPQLTEMLHTAAMLLRGSVAGNAAQALGWVFGAAVALGLAVCAADWLGARWSALAPAVLFSSFTLALSLAWAYGELLPMVMSLAVLIALRQWLHTRGWPWLLLAGILAGLATGCKYTAAVVPVAGAAVIVWGQLGRPRAVRMRWQSLLNTLLPPGIFLLAAGLTFAPWLLKNWAFTGNPFYPLAFPAGYMDALRLWFYSRPDLADRNLLSAALIYLRATFFGLQGMISSDGKSYDATLGPLSVCLLMGAVVGWRRLAAPVRRELALVAVFAAAGYVVWVGLSFVSAFAVQARLFFAIFPALALLGAGGAAALAEFDTPGVRLSVIVRAVLALVLALCAWETLVDWVRQNPLAYLTGAQTAADYRRANLGWYAVAVEHVNALPAGARVEFLWETRSLECTDPARCDPDVVIDRWWHLRRTLKMTDAILERWKAQGFTHVLIYDTGANFVQTQADNPFEPGDWAELQTLRSRLSLVEKLGDAYSLYALP